VSTWRFWALAISYVLSTAVIGAFAMLLPVLNTRLQLSMTHEGLVFGLRLYSQVLGFFVAYAAVRTKLLRVLILAALLQFAGLFLVIVPGAATPVMVRALGAVLWGVGYGALLLGIPTAIAAALGGASAFAVVFGAMLVLGWQLSSLTPVAIGALLPSPATGAILVLSALGAAGLVLATTSQALFSAPPPPRGRSLPIVHRGPVAVAFLSLIPVYPFYWLFRAHGETTSLAPSHGLLSPRAAVGMAFVPGMFPIMMTTLADELNACALRTGTRRLCSPAGVFFWSLFVPPVGIALVQSALNRAATSMN